MKLSSAVSIRDHNINHCKKAHGRSANEIKHISTNLGQEGSHCYNQIIKLMNLWNPETELRCLSALEIEDSRHELKEKVEAKRYSFSGLYLRHDDVENYSQLFSWSSCHDLLLFLPLCSMTLKPFLRQSRLNWILFIFFILQLILPLNGLIVM